MHCQKALTFLTLLPFLAQTALGSVAESSLWRERRAARSAGPVQVAGLPSTQAILNQLPSAGASVAPLAARPVDAAVTKAAGPLAPLLAAVPLQQASIGETEIPARPSGPPVIIVQDVHLNPEAQFNIAAVLSGLADAGVRVVGVEGAFGPFDFSRFRAFPDARATEDVARAFVDRNLIAAPAFVGLASGSPPDFSGIDSPEPYARNVAAYLEADRTRSAVRTRLGAEGRALAERKKSVFSRALLDFDGLREAHHAGKVPLGAYIERLARWADSDDLEVDRFLEAHAMERALDFGKVNEERRVVIERLVRKLTPDEASSLVARTVGYRAGKVGFGDYYRDLRSLCGRHGVDLGATPAFDAYVRYVLLSDGIRPDRLYAAVGRLERLVVDRLAAAPGQRELADRSELHSLRLRLVDFSLTPGEWERYARLAAALGGGAPDLAPFESFYREADARSHTMVTELLARPAVAGRAMLVGGFHTPLVMGLLRDRGIPSAVVSPRITKVDLESGSAYLSIFNREKASLDQLFRGRELFLSPVMVAAVGTGAEPARAREDHLEAAVASRQPTAPGYDIAPAGDGFVRVRRPLTGLDVDLNPSTLERRERGDAPGFSPASFFDRQIRRVLSPASRAYRALTAFAVPAIETPVFGGILFALQPVSAALAQAAPATLAFAGPLLPAGASLLLAAAVITALHAALNRDVRAASIGGWFVGSLLALAPFLLPSMVAAAGLSFAAHALWNSAAVYLPRAGWRLPGIFRVPLSLLGFSAPEMLDDVDGLLEARRSLVFTEDADALDSMLAAKARAEGRRYQRVILRDQSDLDRLMTAVRAENGRVTTSNGPLVDVIVNGGVLFIDYRQSEASLVEAFNSLFDREPFFDRFRASPDLSVVGALDPNDVRSHPVSFYSRFRRVTSTSAGMADPLNLIRAPPAGIDADMVELFESPIIRQRLVGRHRLAEDGSVVFEPGPLARAVDDAEAGRAVRPIVIRGANWDDPAVADFMRQLIVKGEVEINGQIRPIPPGLVFHRVAGGYGAATVANKRMVAAIPGSAAEGAWIVNRENFDALFARSEIMPRRGLAGGDLVERPGLADLPGPIVVRVTDALPEWVWHRLLHSVADVTVELAPGVPVPAAYRSLAPRASGSATRDPLTLHAVRDRAAFLVESADPGFALSAVRREFPGAALSIISVTSETTLADLVSSTEIDESDGRRVFRPVRQRLLDAVAAGRTVVVEGLESNPALVRQLETLLHGNPYLVENNARVPVRGPGRVILVTRPSIETAGVGSVRIELSPTDDDLADTLSREMGPRFSAEDWRRVTELRKVFSTIPAPTVAGLYPARPNFDLERLWMLFSYDNWIEAFENVVIAEYAESPEVAAFMRVAVRLTFEVEREGQDPRSVDELRARRALSRLVPSVPQDSTAWQAADALGLDLLRRAAPELSFEDAPYEVFRMYIAPALARASSADRRDYYADRFSLDPASLEYAPPLDSSRSGLPAGLRAERDRAARAGRVVKALKMFNTVFLKGSPGTGKSHDARLLAGQIGYGDDQIVGPITVGPDMTEADIVGRSYFDGKRTVRVDEAVAQWAAKRRAILIIDEANLADPSLWNVLRGRVDEDHQVIFTGNQEYLAGRRVPAFLRDRVVTVPFEEFDEDFIRARIVADLKGDRQRPAELAGILLGLTELFRGMGRDKPFSLRDVQEMVARVNEFTPPAWTIQDIILTAWRQYEGIFDADERQALRHLINRRYGVDVQPLVDGELERHVTEHREYYRSKGITLVPSAARTVRAIGDFLRLRDARQRRESTLQGKRGVIFEGPSGRGKDELLVQALQEQGFMDGRDLVPGDARSKEAIRRKKVYFRVNASLDYNKMVEAIREAQAKGYVVIVSEMNLLPSALIEGKLNDILTGSALPEFAFFATINSESFGGRERLSTALQNRVIYQKEDDYSAAELGAIAAGEADRLAGIAAGEPTAGFTRPSRSDLDAVVAAHVWIRDQLPQPRSHPTTRQLLNAVAALGRGLSAGEAIDEVYGPIFLRRFLSGTPLPPAAELAAYREKPRVDNPRVLRLMGNSLLPAGKPFSIEIDTASSTKEGGYFLPSRNAIAFWEATVRSGNMQDTFWHEVSHGLFTRDFAGLTPSKDDELIPFYQDMEDLRQEAAFTRFFPASRLSVPSAVEARLASLIASADISGLLSWMRARNPADRLTPRHLFSYALTGYAKGIIGADQLAAMAEILGTVVEINPLALAHRHRDRVWEIRRSIPDSMDEDEIRARQHRALVLINEMRADYLTILDEEPPPEQSREDGDRERGFAEAVSHLRQMELAPLPPRDAPAEAPAPAAPISPEEIEQKKAAIADQRQSAREEAAAAARREMRQIRSDLRRWRVSADRLTEIVAVLTTENHRYSVLRKIRMSGDDRLAAEARRLAAKAERRLADPEHGRGRLLTAAREVARMALLIVILTPVAVSLTYLVMTNPRGAILAVVTGVAGLAVALLVRRFGPRIVVTGWVARLMGPWMTWLTEEGGSEAGARYSNAVAHTARNTEETDPRPIEEPASDRQVGPWQPRGNADVLLQALSKNIRADLDGSLSDFTARRLEARKIFGREGVLEITQFLRDPANGFLRSGGRETRTKKQIVVTMEGLPAPVLLEALDQLVDSGYKVWWIFGKDVPPAQLEQLRRNGPVEVVTADEMQSKVEGLYLYAALDEAIRERRRGQVLSFDQQLDEARKIAAELGIPAGREGLIEVRAPDPGESDVPSFAFSIPGTRLSDLGRLRLLTELHSLDLDGAPVHDLSPIKRHSGLERISLRGVPARDLEPLLELRQLTSVTLNFGDFDPETLHELLRRHANRDNLVLTDGTRTMRFEDVPPIDPRRVPDRSLMPDEQRQLAESPGYLTGGDLTSTPRLSYAAGGFEIDFRGTSSFDLSRLNGFYAVGGLNFSTTENVAVDDILAVPFLRKLTFESDALDDKVVEIIQRHRNRQNLTVFLGGRRIDAADITADAPLDRQVSAAVKLLAQVGVDPKDKDHFIHVDDLTGTFRIRLPVSITDLEPFRQFPALTEIVAPSIVDGDWTPLQSLIRLRRIVTEWNLRDKGPAFDFLARAPSSDVLIMLGNEILISDDDRPEAPMFTPPAAEQLVALTQALETLPLDEGGGLDIILDGEAVDVSASGVQLTDLSVFVQAAAVRNLRLSNMPVQDLAPLLAVTGLNRLTIDATRVTLAEVYFLLHEHPNDNLTVVLNGLPLTAADLPRSYVPRRPPPNPEPRLTLREQKKEAIRILESLGLAPDEPVRHLFAENDDEETFSLDLPAWPDAIDRIARLENLRALFVRRLPFDLTVLLPLVNLRTIVISEPMPIEKVYDLLVAFRNPGLEIRVNRRVLTRGSVPPGYVASLKLPEPLSSETPFDEQVAAVNRFLAEHMPDQRMVDVDPLYPVPEKFKLSSLPKYGGKAAMWPAGKRFLLLLEPTVSTLRGLENVTNLKGLNIAGTRISDLGPIAGAAGLEEIRASLANQLRDISPLARLTRLRAINLHGTQVQDLGPLAGHTALRQLNLYLTPVSDLSPLHGIPLEGINLEGTQVTEEEIRRLAERHPNPEFLLIGIGGGQVKASEYVKKPALPDLDQIETRDAVDVALDIFESLTNRRTAYEQATRKLEAEGKGEDLTAVMEDLLDRRRAVERTLEKEGFLPTPGKGLGLPAEDNEGEVSSIRVNGGSAELDAIADGIVEVALAADSPERRARTGDLLADLLSLPPEAEIHVSELISPSRGPSFGALVSDPSLDVDALARAVIRSAARRAPARRVSVEAAEAVLFKVAALGLPSAPTGALVDSAADDVNQVMMIVNGPEDAQKQRAVARALGDRRPLLTILASEVTDDSGLVSLASVDVTARRLSGEGLRGALLVLPEGIGYKTDVSDDVLRALVIATINDLLNGSILRGPTLLNIHRIARLVAMSA